MKKYRTNIEITSPASNKEEAMEIVGDYLSGNITSGIEMKCRTKPVNFYNHTAAKTIIIALLVTLSFFSGTKAKQSNSLPMSTCQMAAVQPPLNTSDTLKGDASFKKAWEDKQTRQALDFIKK